MRKRYFMCAACRAAISFSGILCPSACIYRMQCAVLGCSVPFVESINRVCPTMQSVYRRCNRLFGSFDRPGPAKLNLTIIGFVASRFSRRQAGRHLNRRASSTCLVVECNACYLAISLGKRLHMPIQSAKRRNHTHDSSSCSLTSYGGAD